MKWFVSYGGGVIRGACTIDAPGSCGYLVYTLSMKGETSKIRNKMNIIFLCF